MQVISTVIDLKKQIDDSYNAPVGFVPTMGALHEGHLSLVRHAIELCPLVVVSIFVNPTQFNDKNDLLHYPRTLEKDLLLMNGILRDNDIVFTPDHNEIYPVEIKSEYHFGNLDNVMEALQRPGHFNGVAQVVNRLFDIVAPDIALFGLKDFQQFAVIKELVRQTDRNIKIIGFPIVREDDGLAMSSRNQLLEPGIRREAAIIYKTISVASEMISSFDIPEIKTFVENTINRIHGFRVEYFEIVDDTELIPVNKKDEMCKDKSYYGCIAVKAGKIRLLDNMEFRLT